MKAFFILDKWCQGNKLLGLSAWESNFTETFSSLGQYNFSKFHFDEFHDVNPKENANEFLLGQLKNDEPDFIFLVLYERPSNLDKLITLDSLRVIRDNLNIPIITIFGDLELPSQCNIFYALEPFICLALYTALAPPGFRIASPKLKYSWVPKSPLVYKPKVDHLKTKDISYFGSSKPERMKLIRFLNRRGLKVWVDGGEREANIPLEAYAEGIKNSKICLSFSRAASCHVTNARVFEVIACETMLLEEGGMETPKFLEPFKEYIPFFSKLDCLDKAKYFLKNENEREEIARSGYLKYYETYSSSRFWHEIFEYVNVFKKKSSVFLNLETNYIGESTIINSGNYWNNSILKRSYPKFELNNYKKFPKILKIYYFFLDMIMINRYLYELVKFYDFICRIPRNLASKAYRKLLDL